ncbi:MAG: VWA domain-containing protein [Scytolyngbya sp. HA4215-MV1]|jgi:Ca-activated chloride channel family protein|nr:VWA domain-containing protein [Scytolyngbya sp. HA4215-MV1]
MNPSQPQQLPKIELIPLRGAIAQNEPTTLDVLVKILPPDLQIRLDRPPLNLGLVIDRSGSMSGFKMNYARQAAAYAVEQLLPTDRVSITIFDDRIETIVPSTLATAKPEILSKIQQISTRGSTALHGGWIEGGTQVSQQLKPDQVNRVLLLSDGLANVGETNPDTIASDVHGLAQRGVSTTTMGIGNDYSEDLLESMARSGDGNFYHIASPEQLPNIFQSELQGLMTTIGHKVSLGINPLESVTVVDILNDLDQTSTGRYKLPNLVIGNPISIVVRLKIPALGQSTDLCQFRLAWDNPEIPERQILRVTLHLPIVSPAQLSDFPPHTEVQQQIAILMAARARLEAVKCMDQGDLAGARVSLQEAKAMTQAAPGSPQLAEELAMLDDLDLDLQSGDTIGTRKKAIFQRYNSQRSRPNP